MMRVGEYILNPCRASSLPFWKTEILVLPENMQVERDDLFDKDLYAGFDDDKFFKLCHNLQKIGKSSLPKGFALKECEFEKIAKHIETCYEGAPNINELLVYQDHPTYSPSLWIAIEDEKSGQIVASGVAEIDKQINEGVFEWIQVSKEFRHKGFGQFVVNELLFRLKKLGALFVTVSGRVDNPTNPLCLYRVCGFEDEVIWHVLTKR